MPLLINSNWWLAFNDDNMIPQTALAGESSDNRAGITIWQVRRAAWLVHRVLDFKGRLDMYVSVLLTPTSDLPSSSGSDRNYIRKQRVQVR